MGKKVTVYGTSTCPYCIKAKEFLKGHSIEFENIDVGANPDKAREMMQKSGQMGVPVLDIDGEIIVGFDKSRIESILGL